MTVNGRVEGQFVVPSGETISVTNNGGGPTPVNITAGSYYPTAFAAHLQTRLNADRPGSGGATWSVTLSTTTGQLTIAMSAGTFTFAAPFSTSDLASIIGFASNPTAVASALGARQHRGLWIPQRPLVLEGDFNMAPLATDVRQTQSPLGKVLTVGGGNRFHRHRSIKWEHVPRARVWEYVASTVNASWERFVKDVQLGIGHSWFSPGSLVQIYDLNNSLVGIAANSGSGVAGWYMKGVTGVEPRKSSAPWVGAWDIEIPELVAEPEAA